ncbi:MAG: redoxin family protein [Phycisphaerales bacterium]|nr:redoxin family protein [Phycisphaerales bacterium]MCI0632114.1 redoxin family protein [Phycisphaerales bacterium]MCI0675302.1 redoxin family protein [Phycisphaerales bacterium]
MNARSKLISILGLSLALAGGLSVMAGDKEGKAESGAKVGQPAPTWTAKDIKGKEWKSTDLANKIVVLEWVNPQCPYCKGAHKDGRIPAMLKELKAQNDVVFIAVNSTHNTSAEANATALKDYGVDYTVLLDTDGKVGKTFGARTTPHVFVIDTKGVLRYQGALDNNAKEDKKGDEITNYVINAVKQIKAGETVTPEYVKSYGCKVHYKEGEAKGQDKEKDKGTSN